MSKRQILMLLGVVVMFFLLLGFPSIFDKILAFIFGLIIVITAYRISPQIVFSSSKENANNDPYKDETKDDDLPFVEYRSNASSSDSGNVTNTISNGLSK